MRAFTLVTGLSWICLSYGQVSPFTGRSILPPDSSGAYRLLIGGHFHGSSTNASGFPAATVLAGIDMINATKANVLLSTGDLFMDPDRDSARYARALFSQLDVALFNAPGNHDLEGSAYHGAYKAPVQLTMGRDRVILLDTERDDSELLNDQLAVLERLADEVGTQQIGHVFILTHRPVWAEEDQRFSALFQGNTRSLNGSNYQEVVLPIIRRIAKSVEVFWISGSMAGRAPASVFFQPQEENITYIQCAVRDQLRDAMLVADVGPGGSISWEALSLTGMPVESVETYNATWWAAHQGDQEEFHWRRLPYLIRKDLSSPAFWYGFFLALFGVVLAWWGVKAWSGRKRSSWTSP